MAKVGRCPARASLLMWALLLLLELPHALHAMSEAQAQAPSGGNVARPCHRHVQDQLRTWAIVEPARPQPGTNGTGVVRHWPTSQLGTWVVESVIGELAQATRIDSRSMTRIEWTASCEATTSSRERPVQQAPRLSDDDLASLLGQSARGVLYVWSPHMPLSIDAYAALVEAARARKLDVTPLLDPAADRDFARASLNRGGLPTSALRVADSVELTFRDLLLHAPSIQVYLDGRLVGSPFPGAHSSDEYGAFLDRVMRTEPPR